MVKYIINEIPPSNNKYMGRGSRGLTMQYQSEKKRWARDINIVIGRNKPKVPYKRATVTLTYYFKTRHRRDPDNYSGKFILDALTECGVIEDDSFKCIDLVLRGSYDKENPRTEILIEEVK